VAVDRFGRGSLLWTPDAATSGFTGLLRVRANDGSRPQDVSDGPFLIAATGHDYYVNDAGTDGDVFTTAPGNDANDGKNPGRPMASISAILDQYHLGPGDVIHVDTGVYNLLRNITVTADDAGILIQGPDGNTAVIDRKAPTGYGFELRGATGVTLDHLAITGARYGVWATAGSNNFTLSNSLVYYNDERGVDVDGSEFSTIIGNEFYGRTGTATDQNNGIDVNAANATISDNVVHNMPIGINVVGVGIAGVITVRDNSVYSNGTGIEAFQSIDITGNTVYGNAGSGINLTRSSRAVNNVVYGNLDGIREVANGSVVSGNRVFGNSRTGIIADGDVPITGNTVYSNATGISVSTYAGRITNNLVYGNSSVGVALAGTGIAGYPPAYFTNNTVYQVAGDAFVVTPANLIVVRNNVLWAANGTGIKVSGANGPNLSSDYNTLVQGAGPQARVANLNAIGVATLAEWQAEARDFHSSGADPMFVDFDGPDNLLGYSGGADHGGDDNFHVLPASPTIDRGDPTTYYLAEPAPNGSRANVGFDGNTSEAQLSPAQAIQVVSPNGGERLIAGQPVNISWHGSGLTAMRPVALINAGGGATGGFAADGYFTPGLDPRATGRAVDLSGVTDPAPAAVYQSYLSAGGGAEPIAYHLPVPAGTYTLRLHFVEPSATAGTRKMEIRLNGALVRENFDIAAVAGGVGKALVLTFP